MLIDYISNLECAKGTCEKFKERILALFFEKGQVQESSMARFVWTRPYQKHFMPIRACVELCRILKPQSLADFEPSFFKAAADLENPHETKNLKDFDLSVRIVTLGFEIIAGEALFFCSAFDEEEKRRLNEAIHNFLEGCNYSCVAMSVSAVESRLLRLMCLTSPESEQELESKTLGQLIYEYIQNKDKYKNVVPEKHEPLLQLCNTYRTLSVHPKKQVIKGTIAGSILNLSIEFLIDQDTKPDVVEAHLIADERNK